MKKMLFLILFFLMTVFALRSDEYCLDNSKHGDLCDGYDYKKYEPTECSCPCWRHRQDFKRGRCSQCWHYHAPQQINFNHVHHPVLLEKGLRHPDLETVN